MSNCLRPGRHVHIVGIGGFGMSAIAQVLQASGYHVSGSDQQQNLLIERLQGAGISIYHGHAAANIGGAEVVLASSAIPQDNPEIQAAQAAGLPVMNRREAIGSITARYRTIAVAGTHGKTTTTALVTHILASAGLDPTAIVGGVMKDVGTNARAGKGPHFVIEADEYGLMFLGLAPEVAILTNIEHDHHDQFPTLESTRDAFRQFIGQIQPDGVLVAGIDSPIVAELAEKRRWDGKPVVTYSLSNPDSDWFADAIENPTPGKTRFVLHYQATPLTSVALPLLGQHNVQNTLAALAAADAVGVGYETAIEAVATFAGTERRAEIMGQAQGITVVNDYAHHPTEIRVMLDAWHGQGRDLWAVWQPHTYTRLRALVDAYINSFGAADHVLVTDVYSVRETPTPGLSAPELASMIATTHPDARYSGGFAATAAVLAVEAQPGDIVLIMSAGDAPAIGTQLLQKLTLPEEPFRG
ncbi:MAG: UDP-N-acetylmuramate--L-alanine ligase [Chloroflexi bacterium]|nr:UDP-N-acetylmuramate--L-alanine ligase [Chloroflexota bacterium]